MRLAYDRSLEVCRAYCSGYKWLVKKVHMKAGEVSRLAPSNDLPGTLLEAQASCCLGQREPVKHAPLRRALSQALLVLQSREGIPSFDAFE